jgi:NAD(P)H dehydrogenase (quinone)
VRHAVILAHPDPGSFNAAVAHAYAEAVEACGGEADVRDLYALDFDPRLKPQELPWRADFASSADTAAERGAARAADVICLVYPLWFNAPPAMLKGYVERVLGPEFAARPGDGAGPAPPATGKSLVSVTTSGAPGAWVGQTGALERLRAGFDDHVAAVCGLAVLEHLHLGGVTPGIRRDAADAMLDKVRQAARRLFGPAAAVESTSG